MPSVNNLLKKVQLSNANKEYKLYIYIRFSEVIFVFLRVIRRADFLHICCFHPIGDRTFPLIFSTQYVVRLHSFKSLSHTLGMQLCFVSKVVWGQRRLIFLFQCESCNDIKYTSIRDNIISCLIKSRSTQFIHVALQIQPTKIYKERIVVKFKNQLKTQLTMLYIKTQ